ncbi:hypothetical protein Droror1_Dr00009450 [Drosera rotundifolia]
MSLCAASSVSLPASKPDNANVIRRTGNFHPTLWGDRFSTYAGDDKVISMWQEEADKLKVKVRKMLMDRNSTENTRYNGKLNLIDAVQRLGLSYHFEEEINEILEHIFVHGDNSIGDSDLHQTALMFRLLRQHGYRVSCDIFNKFKDTKSGRFKEYIAKDIAAMLSLYEAAHLRVHGEYILDEALDYTTTTLTSVAAVNPSHPLSKHIMHALQQSIRKSLPRGGARRYILMYEEQDSHDDTLLKFAKLDFNILQKMHQKELSLISRWWNNLDVKRNLSWARDRIAELYLWILDLFPSQCASGRKFLAKVIALTSIIDDFYDTYGTPEEHVHFTEAIERWEMSAIDMVPEFMRLCYQTLLDVYSEMEEEIAKEGNAYRIGYAKEAMKTLVRAYFEESKWINSDELPTYEEYMKIALVTCGYPMLIITSLVGMGDGVTKEDFDWLLGGPKIVEAASIITRLMDDMVENKGQLEEQDVRVPYAADCYTYQYGISVQQTHQIFNMFVQDAWKDINEAHMRPAPASRSVLNVALNLSRFMDEIYKDKDGYDDSNGKLKDYVTELLIDPVEIWPKKGEKTIDKILLRYMCPGIFI